MDFESLKVSARKCQATNQKALEEYNASQSQSDHDVDTSLPPAVHPLDKPLCILEKAGAKDIAVFGNQDTRGYDKQMRIVRAAAKDDRSPSTDITAKRVSAFYKQLDKQQKSRMKKSQRTKGAADDTLFEAKLRKQLPLSKN